ncbi:hypothetical protein E2C01_005092 [Portunus trituberculatus]|uniref:Uncharacterized protein n=1 Tax=Portunus trituberculatus TaxID=210409 RepID=A0A5B7CRQ5_PORTR|nr:hypothetical protein [Portunus trituberculatus]
MEGCEIFTPPIRDIMLHHTADTIHNTIARHTTTNTHTTKQKHSGAFLPPPLLPTASPSLSPSLHHSSPQPLPVTPILPFE